MVESHVVLVYVLVTTAPLPSTPAHTHTHTPFLVAVCERVEYVPPGVSCECIVLYSPGSVNMSGLCVYECPPPQSECSLCA